MIRKLLWSRCFIVAILTLTPWNHKETKWYLRPAAVSSLEQPSPAVATEVAVEQQSFVLRYDTVILLLTKAYNYRKFLTSVGIFA